MKHMIFIILTYYVTTCSNIVWTLDDGMCHLDASSSISEQDEWTDSDQTFINTTFFCNIDIWEGSQEEFLERYAFRLPVVIKKRSNNLNFRNQCSKSNLLANYGDLLIRLSSANSFSYDKIDVPFKLYVKEMLAPRSEKSKLGNETFYFFGDVLPDEFNMLLNDYHPPPYHLPSMKPAISFGIAGTGTGVPFHFHGPGFSETIRGSKHWFFYPPDLIPNFHPNETTLHWYNNHDFINDKNILQCTVQEGQAIYFPNHWWHSTLNLEPSVFVSTFLGPP